MPGGFPREYPGFAGMFFLLCQVEDVGQTLQGVVDVMCKLIGKRIRCIECRSPANLIQDGLLLLLLSYAHGGKICQQLHRPKIVRIERLCPAMRHDPYRAPDVVNSPRQEDAVGDEGRIDLHGVKKLLEDTEKLGRVPFEANAASARNPGQHRIEEVSVFAGGRDSLVIF